MFPRRTWRARLLAVSTLFATIVATAVATQTAAHAATAQTFEPGTVVSEAPDWPTARWGDPWDFSNAEDVVLDNGGPASGLISPRIGAGVVSYSTTGRSYISPLWGGYTGALLLGRDGALPSNRVDIGYWSRFHLHAYVSRTTVAGVQYFTCTLPSPRCQGGQGFVLSPGWNDVDLPVRPPGATGRAQGIRLAFNATALTSIQVDYLRLYHASDSSQLTWSSPSPGLSARLYWSDGASYPTSRSRHGGPVESSSGPVTVGGQGSVTTNVSGYPRGTRFYAVSAQGVVTPLDERLLITSMPAPIVDSPSAAGCGDYAMSAVGHSWHFTSVRSLAGYRNMRSLAFVNGRLSATNYLPQRNDPLVYLPVGRTGIDGRKWHHLTVTEAYDGRFGLANAPGGGSVARILWMAAGRTIHAQTNDIVTYTGKRTYTIDMSQSTSTLTEPDGSAATRYPFAASYRLNRIRWDPNEDPGSRRWHLYSVRLGADCSTGVYFNVNWHDAQYTAGNRAVVVARDAWGHDRVIARVTEHSGTNTVRLWAHTVWRGKQQIRVQVYNAAGMARGYASGTLTVIR